MDVERGDEVCNAFILSNFMLNPPYSVRQIKVLASRVHDGTVGNFAQPGRVPPPAKKKKRSRHKKKSGSASKKMKT